METYSIFRLLAALACIVLFSAGLGAQSGSTYRFESKYLQNQLKSAGLVDETPIAMIGISTDLSRSTTGSGAEQSQISNGKLGISLVSQYFYGDLSFAVIANGRQSTALNVADTAFFYNNLLLAQNRSSGFSEFSGSVGVNKLLPALGIANSQTDKTGWAKAPYWLAENIGFYYNFRTSNQTWTKASVSDTLSTDILLSANSFLLSLQLFDYKIESPDWGHFQVLAFVGRTNRRLGGNYALASTTEREMYLGTDKTVFKGWEYGVKMEIGPFYGKATFTEFNIDDNIPGFSGPQLSVNLGAVITLDLKAFKR